MRRRPPNPWQGFAELNAFARAGAAVLILLWLLYTGFYELGAWVGRVTRSRPRGHPAVTQKR